jgi:hypothetical protein
MGGSDLSEGELPGITTGRISWSHAFEEFFKRRGDGIPVSVQDFSPKLQRKGSKGFVEITPSVDGGLAPIRSRHLTLPRHPRAD